MPKRSSKLPRDPNQLAARIVALSTGQVEDAPSAFFVSPNPVKNQAAVSLGKLGGLKGGKARAAKLTAEQRREIASKASRARWEDVKNRRLESE